MVAFLTSNILPIALLFKVGKNSTKKIVPKIGTILIYRYNELIIQFASFLTVEEVNKQT